MHKCSVSQRCAKYIDSVTTSATCDLRPGLLRRDLHHLKGSASRKEPLVPGDVLTGSLPSGYVKIAIENGDLEWIFPLKMVIFHCYVSLPEGNIVTNIVLTSVLTMFGGSNMLANSLKLKSITCFPRNCMSGSFRRGLDGRQKEAIQSLDGHPFPLKNPAWWMGIPWEFPDSPEFWWTGWISSWETIATCHATSSALLA